MERRARECAECGPGRAEGGGQSEMDQRGQRVGLRMMDVLLAVHGNL